MSFFERTELVVRPPTPQHPLCEKCGLYKTCISPKMPVAGEGKRKILIVGEAPGANEDQVGKPFVGKAGQRLQGELRRAGIEMFRDCWVTNALSCRPEGNVIKNRRSIDYCRPLVLKAIETLKPRTIILAGLTPVQSVIGHLWKEDVGGAERWTGWRIPLQRWNCWVCPVAHPAYLEYMQDPVRDRDFTDQIRWAAEQRERPWKDGLPEYEKQVQIILDPDEAGDAIENMHQNPLMDPITFDFETDRLKPDHKDSRIVCCSICNGQTSIAFPWTGDAIYYTKKLLTDPNIPKWGWNVKFEQRFCKAKLGIRVLGWKWDGMTSAHSLDSRDDITGLKFQSFVLLGAEDYSSAIRPMLESAKFGNDPNNIYDVPLNQLLRYCALDSLYEWIIDNKQQKELLGVSND